MSPNNVERHECQGGHVLCELCTPTLGRPRGLCSAPLLIQSLFSQDAPKGEGPGAEGSGGGVPAQEEGGGDISGTQFVCETVIRSLTLEEAPDHAPLRGTRPGSGKGSGVERYSRQLVERVC